MVKFKLEEYTRKLPKTVSVQVPGIVKLDNGVNTAPSDSGEPFTIYAAINTDAERALVHCPPEWWDKFQVDNLPILIKRDKRTKKLVLLGTDPSKAATALNGNPIPPNYGIMFDGEGLLPLLHGGTHADLSATGGTSFAVWQESAGADFTVRAITVNDLPTVTVPKGGTGKTSVTTGNLLLGAGASALTELAPSTSGFIVQSNGSTFVSAALNLTTNTQITGTLPLTRGGTNADLSTMTTGAVVVKNSTATFTSANWTSNNLIVGAGTGAPTFIAPSTSGFILQSNGTTFTSAALNLTTNTQITGTLIHERGGLEADVSAYSGLLKISGGATSQAVAGTDYTSPTGTENLSNKTITASTLNSTIIGGSSPAAATVTTFTSNPDSATQNTFSTVGVSTHAYAGNNTTPATLNLYKARGTIASRAAVDGNDVLGVLAFQGYDGTNAQTTASISAIAQEDFDTAGEGTNLRFQVTRSGATSPVTIVDMSWNSVTIDGTMISDDITVNPSSSIQILGNTSGLTVIRSSADTTSPVVNLYKSRGSIASQSAVSSGDFIGTVNFQSFGDQQQTRVQILATATETHSATVGGSKLEIYTTANTTETLGLAVTVGQDKSLSVEGDMTVGDGVGGQFINIDGAAGQNRDLIFQSNGSNRWIFRTNSTAESAGTQAGSNFVLRKVNDDGTTESTVFSIVRSSNATDFAGLVTAAGGLRSSADPGGAASTVTYTNATIATGGAAPATPGTVARWLRIYDGVTTRYIPMYV